MTRMVRCNELNWAWHRTGTEKCKMVDWVWCSTGTDVKSLTECDIGPEQRAVKIQSVCRRTGMESCKWPDWVLHKPQQIAVKSQTESDDVRQEQRAAEDKCNRWDFDARMY